MATASQWVQGSRPRTWPAAVAPVAAGTGAAVWELQQAAAGPDWAIVVPRALLALAVALSLQIGVNYANDYSDGVRGTDDDRVGPFRLTGSGAAPPAAVKRAAVGSLAAGALFGVVLIALAGIWWMLIIGAAAVAAAWFYTGGKKPYGYLGLGELFVFVFFGLVAVNGTTYAITLQIGAVGLLASVAVGLLAVAIMLTNNLRDIPTDSVSGKQTLAVRLGDRGSRLLYTASVFVPFLAMVPVIVWQWPAALVLLALPLAARPARTVLGGATGRELIPVLVATGRLELVFSLLLLIGLWCERVLTVLVGGARGQIGRAGPRGLGLRVLLRRRLPADAIVLERRLVLGVVLVEQSVLLGGVLVEPLALALTATVIGFLPAHRRAVAQPVQRQDRDQHRDQGRQHPGQDHPHAGHREQPPDHCPQGEPEDPVQNHVAHEVRVERQDGKQPHAASERLHRSPGAPPRPLDRTAAPPTISWVA